MAGIYIHIPFCKKACHYCNFHFSTTLHLKTQLIESIVAEISLKKNFFERELVQNQEIQTIYFGGGTPSLLSKHEIAEILNTIYKHCKIAATVEITFEANPDDLTNSKLKELKALNVDRLSIGIQSFQEEHLTYMNRAHTAKEAIKCIEESLQMGWKSLNIDLIYGIPNMTTKMWEQQLKIASSYAINHLSAYALTVEPKTALHNFIQKKKSPPLDEELIAEQFLFASEYLEDKTFRHYEISNFALKDQYSKHNTAYWKGSPYLGVGPSAHSYIRQERSWNVSNNIEYIKAIKNGSSFQEHETLSLLNQFNEYLMTGLRTIWGIDLQYIEYTFGISFKSHLLDKIAALDHSFYNKSGKDTFVLSKKGWLWSDTILESLILI